MTKPANFTDRPRIEIFRDHCCEMLKIAVDGVEKFEGNEWDFNLDWLSVILINVADVHDDLVYMHEECECENGDDLDS